MDSIEIHRVHRMYHSDKKRLLRDAKKPYCNHCGRYSADSRRMSSHGTRSAWTEAWKRRYRYNPLKRQGEARWKHVHTIGETSKNRMMQP